MESTEPNEKHFKFSVSSEWIIQSIDASFIAVKNLEDTRSKGARCDQSGKSETIKLLNTILGETKYYPANTKGRNKTEFCIIQEMILRYNNKNKVNNKTWFLTPQEAIINNIEKASF